MPGRAGTKGTRGAAGTVVVGTNPLPLLTPVSPQGPGPPGPLGLLGPLWAGVVLRAHVGDSGESVLGAGCGTRAPTDPGGSGTLRHPQAALGHSPCAQQVIKKTRFPHWDEVLEFELPEGELGEAVLSVEVWDWDIVGKNDFLGQVRTSGHTGMGQGPGGTSATPVWGLGDHRSGPTGMVTVAHADPTCSGLSPKGGAGQGTGTCPPHPDPLSPRSSSSWTPSAQAPPGAGSSSCPSPAPLRTTGECRQRGQVVVTRAARGGGHRTHVSPPVSLQGTAGCPEAGSEAAGGHSPAPSPLPAPHPAPH